MVGDTLLLVLLVLVVAGLLFAVNRALSQTSRNVSGDDPSGER
jgi:hypothetical protein